MGKNDEFPKNIKKAADSFAEAMQERQEKRRVLELSGEEISKILSMDDTEIEDLIADRGFDFDQHYIRVKTSKAESEGYMKSPDDLRNWLKRTNLN